MGGTRSRAIGRSRFAGLARFCMAMVPLLATACGAPRYVQLAQDSFSKGAAIENAAAFVALDRVGAAAPATNGGALIHYIDARDNIRLALSKQKTELDSDGLTGPAFALQAMISWRLDALRHSTPDGKASCAGTDYIACARDSAAQAVAQIKDPATLNADSFMMTIMPGLLDHNLALNAAPRKASAGFRSAYDHIDAGIAKLGTAANPINGPVTPEQQLAAYGLLAEYQTLRAWYAALNRASSGDASVPADQRISGGERRACWFALIKPRGVKVTDRLIALDPNQQLVKRQIVDGMRGSLDLTSPAPPGTCPSWLTS
jgi:hypothetical protein